MEIATSQPHHVLVGSDSLDPALSRKAQSTKRNLQPLELSPGFWSRCQKCEKSAGMTMHLLFSVVFLLQMCGPVLPTAICSKAEKINVKERNEF